MLRSLLSVVRHPLRAACAVIFLLGVPSMPATPVTATAPFPPLSGCLGSGSFFLQDDACSSIRPIRGDQFGPITSVQRVTLQPGESVVLSYPGGDSIDFNAPQGPCGENGCARASVQWRAAATGAGVGFEGGCGANDPSCQVSISPAIGDAGEDVAVVLAQRYNGINPVDGVAYAIYAPPQLYPARIDPITATGKAIQAESGEAAYAVRDGTSALQAECVASDWWIAASRQTKVVAPRCITLSASDGSYQGVLPNERRWTITAAPAGELLEPIGARPTSYRRITVAPADDDIWETITREDRPVLELTMVPQTTTMDLGATQDVTLTLRAVGGDNGTLADITFATPDTLEAVAAPDAALAIGDPSEAIPTPLLLGKGAVRTFHIPVTALGTGTTILRVTGTAIDDVGGTSVDGVSIPITVGFGAATEDPSLPTPVITHARDIPATLSDAIEGTIAGEPGGHVVISLASARRATDGGSCARTMSGDDIESLGSVGVDIGPDGSGTFQLVRRLGPGRSVYGVAVAGTEVSAVGECVAVTSSEPKVSVDVAEIAESAAGKGGTATTSAALTVRLSDPSESQVTVTVATADGTATAPADYVALPPTTLTFEPGQVSLPIDVDVIADGKQEPDETFAIVVSDVTGGVVDPETVGGTITITDPAETGNADDPSDLRGTYSVRTDYGGAWTKVKDAYRVTRYDRKTGRLVNQRPGYKLTFTVKGDRMRATTKGQKGYVPVYWDCTISVPKGTLTIRCDADQPRYHNLKADHWVEVWTKDKS